MRTLFFFFYCKQSKPLLIRSQALWKEGYLMLRRSETKGSQKCIARIQ
jgi:hypothetical protein